MCLVNLKDCEKKEVIGYKVMRKGKKPGTFKGTNVPRSYVLGKEAKATPAPEGAEVGRTSAYTKGFHVFKARLSARDDKAENTFRFEKNSLVIVKVKLTGSLKQGVQEDSYRPCYLGQRMTILGVVR